MANYIILISLTQQGIKRVKKIPEWEENFRQLCDSNEVNVLGHYFTFRQYDVVDILEASDDTIFVSKIYCIYHTYYLTHLCTVATVSLGLVLKQIFASGA